MMLAPIRPSPQRIITQLTWDNSIYDRLQLDQIFRGSSQNHHGTIVYTMLVPIRPNPHRIIIQQPWDNSVCNACSNQTKSLEDHHTTTMGQQYIRCLFQLDQVLRGSSHNHHGTIIYTMLVPIRPSHQRIIIQQPWDNSIYNACSNQTKSLEDHHKTTMEQ